MIQSICASVIEGNLSRNPSRNPVAIEYSSFDTPIAALAVITEAIVMATAAATAATVLNCLFIFPSFRR